MTKSMMLFLVKFIDCFFLIPSANISLFLALFVIFTANFGLIINDYNHKREKE